MGERLIALIERSESLNFSRVGGPSVRTDLGPEKVWQGSVHWRAHGGGRQRPRPKRGRRGGGKLSYRKRMEGRVRQRGPDFHMLQSMGRSVKARIGRRNRERREEISRKVKSTSEMIDSAKRRGDRFVVGALQEVAAEQAMALAVADYAPEPSLANATPESVGDVKKCYREGCAQSRLDTSRLLGVPVKECSNRSHFTWF